MTPTAIQTPSSSADEDLTLRRRFLAARESITKHEAVLDALRTKRDDAIRGLVAIHGPAATARITGLSLSSVRLIKGRA